MTTKSNLPIILLTIFTAAAFAFVLFKAESDKGALPAALIDKNKLINSETPIKGEATASATLVEFSDFECPACGSFYPVVKELENMYRGELRVAYKHYPLPQHPNARQAAEAAEAAKAQGKFWEYHDLLFDNQQDLSLDNLKKLAQQINLNMDQFNQDLESNKYADIIQKDIDLGKELNINSTPTFYLNGRLLKLKTYNDLQMEIEKTIKESSGTNAQ